MDKEGNSLNGQGKSKTAVKPAEVSQENEDKSGTQTKLNTKSKKKSKIKPELLITLITALITAITSIVVALISSQSSKPGPTPTLTSTTMPSPTYFFTDLPVIFTDMPPSTIVPSLTNAIPVATVPSETITLIPQPKLIAILEANKTSGRKPLTVKLDARGSYLNDYDGQTYVCRNGACYYTWKVYVGGQQFGKSVTDSGGTFDYTFGKQGTYMITVWICRGRDGVDCNGSGAQIIVTK